MLEAFRATVAGASLLTGLIANALGYCRTMGAEHAALPPPTRGWTLSFDKYDTMLPARAANLARTMGRAMRPSTQAATSKQ